jgi:peptidoglycan/LPS O-acetylase OafA/YrhL
MQYRAEIDGLRAVAVIPVILFHAGYQWFSGGFVGVDIFFVISGYLITNIIVSEMKNKTFSLSSFYERRARRILPALFLAMFISAILAYFLLLPHQIKDFAQSVVAAAFFASNFFFYLETDYFNEFTNNAPLLHTWTLAVEEQFYIVFPILMLVLYRMGAKAVNVILFAIFAVSLISAEIVVDTNANLAFYSTHTRSWELMVGCLAALTQLRCDSSLASLKQKCIVFSFAEEFLCIAAVIGIVSSFLLFDESVRHPSLITLVPVLSTAVLLLFSHNSKLVKGVLSWRLLVYVGLLSYSLYIFHQPILSFAHFSSIDVLSKDSLMSGPILLLLIFIVSYLSYHYFEKPLRYNKNIAQGFVLGCSVILLCLFAALGYWTHKNDGFQPYFAKKFEGGGGILLVDVDKEKKVIDVLASNAYAYNATDLSLDNKRRVLVLGDSMARDAFFSLYKYTSDKLNSDLDVRVLYVDDECMGEFEQALREGIETACSGKVNSLHAKTLLQWATTILVTAKWQEFTYNDGFLLSTYLDEQYAKNTVLIGSILFDDITSVSLGFARKGVTVEQSAPLLYDYIRLDRAVISDKLRDIVLTDGSIRWLEKSVFFCQHSERTCRLFDENKLPLIWDNAHLTLRSYNSYAIFLLPYID